MAIEHEQQLENYRWWFVRFHLRYLRWCKKIDNECARGDQVKKSNQAIFSIHQFTSKRLLCGKIGDILTLTFLFLEAD